MKFKKTMVKFTCDKCGKESKEIEDGKEGYPYKDGWVYAYRINIKLSKDKIKDLKDKQFCSHLCLSKFMKELLIK